MNQCACRLPAKGSSGKALERKNYYRVKRRRLDGWGSQRACCWRKVISAQNQSQLYKCRRFSTGSSGQEIAAPTSLPGRLAPAAPHVGVTRSDPDTLTESQIIDSADPVKASAPDVTKECVHAYDANFREAVEKLKLPTNCGTTATQYVGSLLTTFDCCRGGEI